MGVLSFPPSNVILEFVPEKSSTSILISGWIFSCRDQLSLLSLCWLGKCGWMWWIHGRIYPMSFRLPTFSISMIICVFLENQGNKLQQQLLLSFVAQTRQSLCLIPACCISLSCHVENWWWKEKCFQTRVLSSKHLGTSWTTARVSLSATSGSPWDSSQHSGIKILKMAKLWLTQPGWTGKERLERQERDREEVPGWGIPLGSEPPLLLINYPPQIFLPGVAQTRLGWACALLLMGFPTGISASSSERGQGWAQQADPAPTLSYSLLLQPFIFCI